MILDFWYGNKVEDISNLEVYFNNYNGCYWGNMFVANKCVGDFTADNSSEISNTFKHLNLRWL